MNYRIFFITVMALVFSCKKEPDTPSAGSNPNALAELATIGLSNSTDFVHFTLNNSLHFDGNYLLDIETSDLEELTCMIDDTAMNRAAIEWRAQGINTQQNDFIQLFAHVEDLALGSYDFEEMSFPRVFLKVFTNGGNGIGGVYEMESGTIELLQLEFENNPGGVAEAATVMTFEGEFRLWFTEFMIEANGVAKSSTE